MNKLGAKELRLARASDEERQQITRNPIYIVLDNVLDTYNIGSVFRLADAVAAEKVILCEGSETPPNSRIKKASINTTEWVSWEYYPYASDAVTALRKSVPGIQVVAVEQSPKSVPYTEVSYTFPVALVVGHETEGVSEEVLEMADYIAELPMWGINKSMNVMVSLAIALFEVVRHMPEK